MMYDRKPASPDGSGMAVVMERNVRAILERQREVEHRKGWQERLADAVTRFAGSMRFVYCHLALYGLWVVVNVLPTPLPKFDRSFVALAIFASVEAIFLSTFILISQNRIAAIEEERAHLDLQISLLAEHEVTRLIRLVKAMAHQMGIEEAADETLAEFEREVKPDEVLKKIEELDERKT